MGNYSIVLHPHKKKKKTRAEKIWHLMNIHKQDYTKVKQKIENLRKFFFFVCFDLFFGPSDDSFMPKTISHGKNLRFFIVYITR